MPKVVFTNIPAIDAKLQKLGAKIANGIARKALRAAAKELAQEVKAQVPVDEGILKSEVQVKAIKRSRTKLGMRVLLEDTKHNDGTTSIVGFIEYGTSHNEANPFMRRSLDNKGADVKETAIEGITEAIDDACNEVK